MNDDPLRPLFEVVSPDGVAPQQILITGLGRAIASKLGLATPVELVGVIGVVVGMLEASPELYAGKGWGAALGDLVAGARYGDLRYEPREYAFVLAGTGERVPLTEIPLDAVELLNAFHPEDDPPPDAAGQW